MSKPDNKPICIFRPGRHTAMNGTTLEFSERDLAATAAAYDPGRHEAPMVIGHPETDAPAWGWVQGLAFQNGRLLATPGQVDAQFAEMVNSGRFKKISASFYTPTAPGNPTPGVYALRHVGFLGAQPPSVKGLGDAKFASPAEGVVTVEYVEVLSPQTKEQSAMPDNRTPPGSNRSVEDLAQWEQRLAEAQARFAEQVRQIDERAAADRARVEAAFAESLVREGKILPRQQAGLVAVLAGMRDEDKVMFSEQGQQVSASPKQVLKDLLTSMPARIQFGELFGDSSQMTAAGIEVPPGYRVDRGRQDLHQRALAYAEQHKTDFVTAVRMIERAQ
ncbi:MAG: peptidase [Magnetococcales bacterium]|nr:peptidase [Magnetococcales bacterium]